MHSCLLVCFLCCRGTRVLSRKLISFGGEALGAHSEREDFAKSATERCNRPMKCTFEFWLKKCQCIGGVKKKKYSRNLLGGPGS